MSDELPVSVVIGHCRAGVVPAPQETLKLLESILLDIGHSKPGERKAYCWCDKAIGDPRQPDQTAACRRAKALNLAPVVEDSE